MLHFLPASLLGDGWLQLSTNNHRRSIWLHSFCLGWGNNGHVLCVPLLFVLGVVVGGILFLSCSHKKIIVPEQMKWITFLQRPKRQPFKRLPTLFKFFSVRSFRETCFCLPHFNVCKSFFVTVTFKKLFIWRSQMICLLDALLSVKVDERLSLEWRARKVQSCHSPEKDSSQTVMGPRGAWLC